MQGLRGVMLLLAGASMEHGSLWRHTHSLAWMRACSMCWCRRWRTLCRRGCRSSWRSGEVPRRSICWIGGASISCAASVWLGWWGAGAQAGRCWVKLILLLPCLRLKHSVAEPQCMLDVDQQTAQERVSSSSVKCHQRLLWHFRCCCCCKRRTLTCHCGCVTEHSGAQHIRSWPRASAAHCWHHRFSRSWIRPHRQTRMHACEMRA